MQPFGPCLYNGDLKAKETENSKAARTLTKVFLIAIQLQGGIDQSGELSMKNTTMK